MILFFLIQSCQVKHNEQLYPWSALPPCDSHGSLHALWIHKASLLVSPLILFLFPLFLEHLWWGQIQWQERHFKLNHYITNKSCIEAKVPGLLNQYLITKQIPQLATNCYGEGFEACMTSAAIQLYFYFNFLQPRFHVIEEVTNEMRNLCVVGVDGACRYTVKKPDNTTHAVFCGECG